MATDPIDVIARQRIIKASADLEVQLSEKSGGGVAIEILRRFRDRSAESLKALVFINFLDPAEIPKAVTLQNEVKRYDEMVGCMREVINEGITYDREMNEEEREEMLEILLSQGPRGEREAIELGLIEPPPPDA